MLPTMASGVRSCCPIDENGKGLAIETITAARNIALRDLRNARILWVDDHPENNNWLVNDIRARLHRIGIDFELSTDMRDALKRLQSRPFHVVITNYGKGRCGRDEKAIADCLLEGVKMLPFRSPVIVFSAGVTAEMSDTMKCKGAIAETDTPDVLFAWIVRALDAGPNFRPSEGNPTILRRSGKEELKRVLALEFEQRQHEVADLPPLLRNFCFLMGKRKTWAHDLGINRRFRGLDT
jgi:hypothetical protein